MGLLAFIFRAIVFLIIFRLASMVLGSFFRGFSQGSRPVKTSQGAGPSREARGQVEELVKDPICGIHTARSSAIAGRFEGRDAYFCSEECAQKARAAS
jgi:YHS domain-containing protein